MSKRAYYKYKRAARGGLKLNKHEIQHVQDVAQKRRFWAPRQVLLPSKTRGGVPIVPPRTDDQFRVGRIQALRVNPTGQRHKASFRSHQEIDHVNDILAKGFIPLPGYSGLRGQLARVIPGSAQVKIEENAWKHALANARPKDRQAVLQQARRGISTYTKFRPGLRAKTLSNIAAESSKYKKMWATRKQKYGKRGRRR